MAIKDGNIVGEQFWLNMVAEQIYTVFDRQSKAVENLQKLIMWAFSLFSGTGVVVIFFARPAEYNTTAIALFGGAFAILVIAYVVATQSSFPVAKGVRPNDMADIARVHSKTVRFNNLIFRTASFITFVGFFLIAAGILVQFSPKDKTLSTNQKQSPELKFTAKIVDMKTWIFIPVTASYMKDSIIFVQVAPCDAILDPKNKLYNKNRVHNASYIPVDSSGVIYGSSQWSKPISDCFRVVVRVFEKQKGGFTKEVVLTKELKVQSR